MNEKQQEEVLLYAKLLEAPFEKDCHSLEEELEKRGQYQARLSELFAQAEMALAKKVAVFTQENHALGYPPTVARELVKGAVLEEQLWYTRCDELLKTLRYQMDMMRSILSFEKSLLNNFPTGHQGYPEERGRR
jgi:hypothetical protein